MLSALPIISRLSNENAKQAWYADDASATGNADIGGTIWLIVKEEILPLVETEGSGVSVTKEGKRHLGAAIGTQAFKEAYVRERVATWVREIDRLAAIAETQPH